MDSISKNIILDLLPTVLAGEASEESKDLVEAYAQHDPEIAEYLRTNTLEDDLISRKIDVPDDLEMKTLRHVRRRVRRQMWVVATATAFILMLPLVAMQFTQEVNWGLGDFIVMGFLLFGTGFTYTLITKLSENIAYKLAVGIAVLTGFLLIWVNFAVGIIGSAGNPANLLYAAVFAMGISGAWKARLKPAGMVLTMYATALVQMLVPVIALIFMGKSAVTPLVFAGNAFFAGLFLVSALLFRRVERKG